MNAEIQEYRQMALEFKSELESRYHMNLVNGDIQAAYQIIGELMAFKLIDADDPRIQKNNKSYTSYGIDRGHRFRLDYRRDMSYIPEWLFGRLPVNASFNVNSIEHWGKRVEGNYSGDTIFPSHTTSISIKQCTTPKQVENGFDEMKNILKAAKITLNLDNALECAKEGVYRLYRIEIVGNCISRYKTVGFALIAMQATGMVCSLIIKFDSLTQNWLPVDIVLNEIQGTISKMANGVPVFAYPVSPDIGRKEQKGMMEWSRSLARK